MTRRSTIPAAGYATDGVSKMPGREIAVQPNWANIKRQFFVDPDYMKIRQFLTYRLGWQQKDLIKGETKNKIRGWNDEKRAVEQRKTDIAIEAMMEAQRRVVPDLLAAKAQLIAKIMNSVGMWDRLLPAEKKLCYEIIKTELGEPTKITTVGLGVARDPVEALLEDYGLMRNGRIIIDGDEPTASDGDSEPIAAVSSGSSTETPQG